MTRRRDRMSLRSRLVWSISYILLAVIVALAIPLAIRLSRRGTQELASDTLITAQTMGAYVGAENINNPEALARIADAAPPEIDRVIVTDLNGTVVYTSAKTPSYPLLVDASVRSSFGAALRSTHPKFGPLRYQLRVRMDKAACACLARL